MKVIFRADDLGMSEGINYGIAKAISCGPIKSVGLMPNMPAASHGFDLVAASGVSVGQHTNICLGKPVSDPASIPSLVDERGEFCSSRTIRARTEDTIVLEEAEREIQAQLDRFRALTGRDPAYFEGHAVFSPTFFQALQNVAERNGLFYINPMDPVWSEKWGVVCANPITSMIEACTIRASTCLTTRPTLRVTPAACSYSTRGTWINMCSTTRPLP